MLKTELGRVHITAWVWLAAVLRVSYLEVGRVNFFHTGEKLVCWEADAWTQLAMEQMGFYAWVDTRYLNLFFHPAEMVQNLKLEFVRMK